MRKPLFQRLFSQTPVSAQETTLTKAQGGDADAQFLLGVQCASAEGDARDYPQAMIWYLKAADQNHAMALFNLGIMFESGHGIARDYPQGQHWMLKAANLGDAGAQYHLGMQNYRHSLSRNGSANSESRVEAYKWLRLSGAQGYRGDDDGASADASLGMSSESIQEGNRRAAAFVVSLPPAHN